MKLLLQTSVTFPVCTEIFNFIEMEVTFPEAEVRKKKGRLEKVD